jgi:hypothetical protein
MSPLDLERTFGLIGGDIIHGALSSTSCSRPGRCSATADYRGPLPGLYMCGAGNPSRRRRHRRAGPQRGARFGSASSSPLTIDETSTPRNPSVRTA